MKHSGPGTFKSGWPAERSANERAEYVEKIRLVSEDIASGIFFKRPGKHCAYCDFLPLCMGDKQKAQDSLVQIT
jgi:hypothetical protein